jgi:hypothetical protein
MGDGLDLRPRKRANGTVPESLSGKAAADGSFYRWTGESTEALRAEAIDAGRRPGCRRAAATPTANQED